tara:strand:- start:1085 stop:1528 length:444 start_codon:yes stop_codon:yes gene_type:complete
MAPKIPKYLISALFVASSLFVINCDSEIQEKPSDQSLGDNIQNIPGLPPGIPSFPYIFNGNFFVNGNPGPINSIIISKLGELDSPEVTTGDGEFKDLIIGPRNSDDIKNRIEFFLVKDGKMIKAEEDLPFDIVRNITNVEIELNFNE